MSIKTVSKSILRSWWIVAYILMASILYENTQQRRDHLHQQLRRQWEMLKSEKESKLALQKQLNDHLASYNDPKWIELVLMNNLGLVRKGEEKFYFADPD
jgi:hypothetical protein